MTKKDWIWTGIVGLLILSGIVLVWTTYSAKPVSGQSEAEKYLLQQRDSLVLEIGRLESEVLLYKKHAEALQQEILNLNKNLTSIQSKYDKEISNIASYTNPELEQFFANRYSK